MPKNSAEYMRAYRARKKDAAIRYGTGDGADEIAKLQGALAFANEEIGRLTEEVARLKRELAARPAPIQARRGVVGDAWVPEYRPVPKVRPKK